MNNEDTGFNCPPWCECANHKEKEDLQAVKSLVLIIMIVCLIAGVIYYYV